ncbi:MAG TPA: SDR family oxidoreductase [Candidatus Avalokitesvara rifleensis]|uniref:SDR family oxidoreductase n=1 Tax=Candidatus Avalokitesvara rifleensis TaxID=3367620 RepID=UPI002714463A|nr:SDR family oxidoreductase [Candidatus Brocadiales bacterium]
MSTPRVAIITGATRGVGRACARIFSATGYNVTLFGRNSDLLNKIVEEIKERSGRVLGVKGDVRNPSDVRDAVEKTLRNFGHIDVLVNNAGVGYGLIPLTEFSDKQWHETIDTNLTGVYYFTKAVIPAMKPRRSGIIINISSGAGRHGVGGLSAYCASKFGVIGLTESVAEEVKQYGIKVVALCPGGINTEMHRAIFPEHEPEGLLTPEEVAQKILSLSDPDDGTRSGTSVHIHKRY